MFPALYLRYVENYRPDTDVFGHLPTMSHLQRKLGYQFDGDWTNFPDLLKHAIRVGCEASRDGTRTDEFRQ